jgi:hypothetical protein
VTVPPAHPRFLEKHFQATVIQLAETLNWKCCHFSDSRRSIGNGRMVGDRQAAGFPDLVLARKDRLIFAELKAAKGKLRPAQVEWITALQEVEVETHPHVLVRVWRPTDMASGEIERTLGARR